MTVEVLGDALAPAEDGAYVRRNWTAYRHWLGEATPRQVLLAYCTMTAYQPLPVWLPLHLAEAPPNEAGVRPLMNKLGVGGTGGGKSDTMMHETVKALLINPGCDGLVLTPLLEQLRRSFVPRFTRLMTTMTRRGFPLQRRWYGGQTGSGVMVSELVGGATLQLRPLRDVQNLKGPEYAVAWMDECDQAREPAKSMSIVRGRIREPRAHRHLFLASTNPNGTDRTVVGTFVENRRRPELRQQWYAMRGNYYDNPHLPQNYREANSTGMSRRRFRQEMLGEILTPHSAVYSEFSRLRHAVRFQFDPHKPWVLGYDGGDQWEHAVAAQRRADGAYVIFDEWISDPEMSEARRELEFVTWLRTFPMPNGQKVERRDPSHVFADKAHKRSIAFLTRALKASDVDYLRGDEVPVTVGIEAVRSMLDPIDGDPTLYFAGYLFADPIPARSVAAAMTNYRFLVFADGLVDVSSPLQDNVTEHSADALRYLVVGVGRSPRGAVTRDRSAARGSDPYLTPRRTPTI